MDGDNVDIEEVFSEDGGLLWGSTVANRHGNAMLVGTIVHKLMYCELNHLRK